MRLAAEQPRNDSLGLRPEVRDQILPKAPEERRKPRLTDNQTHVSVSR
jgi:hypothetical protein